MKKIHAFWQSKWLINSQKFFFLLTESFIINDFIMYIKQLFVLYSYLQAENNKNFKICEINRNALFLLPSFALQSTLVCNL